MKEQLSSLHVINLIYFMLLEIWGKVKIEEQLSSLYIAIVATRVKVEEQLSSQYLTPHFPETTDESYKKNA